MTPEDPLEKQGNYCFKVANSYTDAFAFDPDDEHFIAYSFLIGMASHYQLHSLLDVGCGTGRAFGYLSRSSPSL